MSSYIVLNRNEFDTVSLFTLCWCLSDFLLNKMNPSHYIILLIMFLRCRCEEHCSIDNESCISEKKHDMYKKGLSLTQNFYIDLNERYEKYITLIHDAAQSYVECNSTNCGCFNSVITRDLKPFRKKGINEELISATKPKGTFYQIIGGKLYRDKECMFPSRCAGIEHYLYKVLDNLTDLELVINTRDYPQSSVHFGGPLPIFSFSKTPQYYDIMYPAWAFWEGGPAISLYPQGLGRWDKHRISLNKTSRKIPWEDKQSKAFFRGSRTSSERDNLILLSRNKPELVDAQYTKNQAWKCKEDTLNAEPAKEVPLESHCAYKYLFNYRGVAASFRHKHLFLCNSLVFHVGDEWTEFYYDAMKPWIHYIPVPKDSTQNDLEELILFAKHHDELAHKIAKGGRDFIWNKLRMKDVICYWRKLLKSYAKLLTYKPQLKTHLIEVKRRT